MKKVWLAAAMLVAAMGICAVPASAKEYEEGGFTYTVSKKKATVVQAKVEGKVLEIPATLGGFPVTEIGSYAFCKTNGGGQFETIKIPDSVTFISSGAFQDLNNLKTIVLPKNIEEIGYGAFSGCTKLKSIDLGNKLEEISEEMFSDCISLQSVKIPNSVKYIDKYAFEKCYKLSDVKLGKKLQTIEKRAFLKAYKLKSITIPKTVKTIGERAFEKCDELEKVSFQNNNTKLGEGVFYKCSALQKIKLPKNIKRIPEKTFYECTSLKNIVVPKNITMIKKKAFYGCSKLKTIALNKKIYAIGDSAFAESGLVKLQLNQNMQFIGNGAFKATKIRSLRLPEKVTFIGSRVFADCTKLRTIFIPANVRGINPGAFNNCTSLRAIQVASNNKNYSSQQGVLYNKARTYLIQYPLDKAARTFRVPSTVRKIRSYAFSENSHLTNVTSGAQIIGDDAFSYMPSLKRVTLLSGTRVIGKNAFGENTKLTSISIPDSVTTIKSYALYKSKVSRIHIPSNLKKLGYYVFEKCDKIAAFEGGKGAKYKVVDGVLYNGNKTTLLKYPSKKKTTSFVVPNSVKYVDSEAFISVKSLRKLEFGKNLKKIRYHGIYKAKNLKSIIINSKKVSYSSAEGITGCDKLAVIVGPNNGALVYMAEYAGATLITL